MARVCRQASVRLSAERDDGLRSYDRAQHRQRLNALAAQEESTRTAAVNTLAVY
jgi:hypothetical protein